MQTITLGKSNVNTSRLAYGCMRTADDPKRGKQALRTAIEAGYGYFDLADIYGNGNCEILFGEVLHGMRSTRDSIIISSKCGIRSEGQPHESDPARYDFSHNYIVNSVENSLLRLQVDFLDILLLHRPDFLFNAESVASTLQQLKESGKVKYFGVSNFKPSQIDLLQAYCSFPLLVNQVEINIDRIDALFDGTLDQCQQDKIIPQAWCPLGGVAYPAWNSKLLPTDLTRIQSELELQASKYNTENWVVVLAWLLKHPAQIMPIIGSCTSTRIEKALGALDINYTREDWYRLLEARNGEPVP